MIPSYKSVWTWDKARDAIVTLRGRLGFGDEDHLRFLGLRLSLSDGKLYDEVREAPYPELEPMVYYVLYEYSMAKEEVPESGQLVSYRQVPGGNYYYGSLKSRVLDPMLEIFGREPEALVRAGLRLGASRADLGDASIKLYALPKIPIYFVVWGGDEELEASVNLLFDSSVSSYMTAEPLSVLCEVALARLRDMLEPEE
ncbi:hypothetical protein B6U99_04495 [Candidatus Geothermarchaeota archaeon ex4572_27]|nr:MAG: hypothetical protein B6U99_04495 [Candidatus Geothermarchaeota archaeon ex4572_27]